MKFFDKSYQPDSSNFYQAVYRIEIGELLIDEVKYRHVRLLQRASKKSNYDGFKIELSVHFDRRKLAVGSIYPDRKISSKISFSEAPESVIFISNGAKPEHIIKILRNISKLYRSLSPPPFQMYKHDDETKSMNWTIPIAEFIEANARTKHLHQIFMKEHGMHQTSIPPSYK